MAQHVRVELVDDLDGSPAQETVEFGLDGLLYQIDLSAANAEQLRAAFAPYIAGARRPTNGGSPNTTSRNGSRNGSAKPRQRRKTDQATARIRQLTERVKENQRTSPSAEPAPNEQEAEETAISLAPVTTADEPPSAPAVLAPVFQPPQQ